MLIERALGKMRLNPGFKPCAFGWDTVEIQMTHYTQHRTTGHSRLAGTHLSFAVAIGVLIVI